MIRRLIDWIKGLFLPDYDCIGDDRESGTLMNYIRPGEKLENPHSKNNPKDDSTKKA